MYNGNFAYPCIAYSFIFLSKTDGIYYSKSVMNLGNIIGFSEPIKIPGTSSNSQGISATSQGSVGHVVWHENGSIKYSRVVWGLVPSVETIYAYDGLNSASYPCITAQYVEGDVVGSQWIAWQSHSIETSQYTIQTRRRVGIDEYSSIQTFSAGDKVNCRPSISSYVVKHPGTDTDAPPPRTDAPCQGSPCINNDPWYLIPFGYDFGVSIVWDYNGNSVKKVTYTNGSWRPIETLRDGVYSAQSCSRDGWWKYPGLVLFSSLQGPRYNLISQPYITYVPTKVVIQKGWNLVSVPRVQTNYTAEVVFPGTMGDMFGYDPTVGDYVVAATLELGKAYWVYYLKADTITFTGATAADINVSCKKGWNFVGSRDVSMLPIELRLSAGMILGSLFKYDPSIGDYVEAPMLIPGLGTWLYVSQDCILTIPIPYTIQ
jgi:hypothetical protein